MTQLLQVFLLDVKLNFKHFMGVYMIVVPVAILVVLRLFIPTVESTSATLAVVSEGPSAVQPEVVESLGEFLDVQSFPTIDAMERKLRGTGQAEGLYWDPGAGQYVSVLERSTGGNTLFSVAARILRLEYFHENYPVAPLVTQFSAGVPPELSDRTEISPVATVGGSIYIVFMIIIAGFVIGLGVVTDKELGTDKALRVSPVTRLEYFVGKSIYPLIVTLAYAIVALLMLGLIEVNILQVYIVVLASFGVTLLFGLLIGALAKNENEAIGVGKLLSMVVGLGILGATLLPDNWHWVVWWAPFYWIYDVLEGVFTRTIGWGTFAWKTALTVGLSVLFMLLARKKIVAGLS